MYELQSQDVTELAKALSKAQGEMEGAAKNSSNPHFKSKFADLASCWDACREPLYNHGLSITQTMMPIEGGTILVTTLLHASGQWMRSYAPLFLDKQTSQGLGSAISYQRRYSLAAMVGLYQEDDDGQKAEPRKTVIECSKEQVEEFIQNHDQYDRTILLDYLTKRSAHYKKTIFATVYELNQNIEGFKKEIEGFVKKHGSPKEEVQSLPDGSSVIRVP